MNELAQQIEELRKAMERRHMDALAKMESLRGEGKADLATFKEEVRLAVNLLERAMERQELRVDSRMEGLGAVLTDQLNSMDHTMTMLSGIVTSHWTEQVQRFEQYRDKFEGMELWFQQVSDHEARLTRIEEGRPPAA